MQLLPEGQQSSDMGSTTDVRSVQEHVSIVTPQCPNTSSISTLKANMLCGRRPISRRKNTKKTMRQKKKSIQPLRYGCISTIYQRYSSCISTILQRYFNVTSTITIVEISLKYRRRVGGVGWEQGAEEALEAVVFSHLGPMAKVGTGSAAGAWGGGRWKNIWPGWNFPQKKVVLLQQKKNKSFPIKKTKPKRKD